MYSFHTAECFLDQTFLLKYERLPPNVSRMFSNSNVFNVSQCFPMFSESNVSAVDFLLKCAALRPPTQPPAQRSTVCLLLHLPRYLLKNPQTHQVPLYTLLCFVSFMNITTIDIIIIMTSISVELSNVIMEIF